MDIETVLAKVNIFEVEPNRQSATRRLLKNYTVGDDVWFIEDDGLRYARSPGHFNQTITRASQSVIGYSAFKFESGFDINAKNGPTINYSSMLVTKHALHRWEQRARCAFPSISTLYSLDELLSAKMLLIKTGQSDQSNEFFMPVGDGAFIIEVVKTTAEDCYNQSVSEWKKQATAANYTFDKTSKRWRGEFVPRGGSKIVKTYIGWDELKRGGTFNSVDWYRSQFEWQQVPSEWRRELADMGIDL